MDSKIQAGNFKLITSDPQRVLIGDTALTIELEITQHGSEPQPIPRGHFTLRQCFLGPSSRGPTLLAGACSMAIGSR